jgi:CheY-like chemotaxis protein
MSKKPILIAVSIKDRVALQLACGMLSSAGASVQICDDAAAILQIADDLQAIVLGLAPVVDETVDTLVILRQRLATLPIYVLTDAAGQRHAKRVKSFGATQVIPHEELQRRVGPLVQQVAQVNQIDDFSVRSPGWAANKVDQGYEVQSMDMEAWLSIPGNRRLLGLEEPAGMAGDLAGVNPVDVDSTDVDLADVDSADVDLADGDLADGDLADAFPQREERPVADRMPKVPVAPLPPSTPRDLAPAAPSSAPTLSARDLWHPPEPSAAPPRPDLSAAAAGESDGVPCGLTDCPRLVRCREEHDLQNAAILETHIQREKRLLEMNQAFRDRLQAELRAEWSQLIDQRIAAGELKSERVMNERIRLGIAAATRHLKLILGALAGSIAILIILGIALAWRLWL